MMLDIRPIRNDSDLAWAIGEISRYFDAPPPHGTPEADRFDVLSDLIEAYENRNHSIEAQEPIVFLKAFMELSGRAQADLAELLGSRSRASEILNRKRALTVDMIHKLVTGWHIPAGCLIAPYELVA